MPRAPQSQKTRESVERHYCVSAAKEKCHGNFDESVKPLTCGTEQSWRNARRILAIHTQ